MTHPATESLRDWAMGTLTPAEARRVEQHVEGCDGCFAALQAEARLELELHEVAVRSDGRRSHRPLVVIIAAIAAVALVAVLQPGPSPAPEPVSATRVSCAAVDDASACVDEAEALGLMVDPGRVPRYDQRDTCARCGLEVRP